MKTFPDRQSTKRERLLCLFATLLTAARTSTTAQDSSPATGTPVVAGSPVASIEDYAVVSRGPNHAIRERTVYEPGPSGGLVPRVHRVTELGSGLNHLNGQGQWEPSRDDFEITPEGYAVASHCQHKLIVAPNLNSPQGVLDCQAPDGTRIRTAVLGLVLFDPASGKTLQVASVKDCPGQQTGPNEITFPDGFQGLKASVRVRNERGRFHEEVLLSQKLTPTQLTRLGFSPDSVRLEIWTEFLEAPTPTIQSSIIKAEPDPTRRAAMADPDAVDDFLDFSAFKMTRGAAFVEGHPGTSAVIFKRWLEQSGRHFLIEACDYADLAPLLVSLPETAQFKPTSTTKGLLAQSRSTSSRSSVPQRLALRTPPARAAANPDRNFQIARLDPSLGRSSAPQINLDFTMLSGTRIGYVFQRDGTYFISSSLNVCGDSTWEGGAVLKFARGASVAIVPGPGPVQVNWLATQYSPVVFTAVDDNSVGEQLSGGSPSGYYANQALQIVNASSAVLANLRISYAKQAIYLAAATADVSHLQVAHCQSALFLGGSTAHLHNVLFANTLTNFSLNGGCTATAEHLTCDQAAWLASSFPYESGCSLHLTNSILSDITNLTAGVLTLDGSHNGFYGITTHFGDNQTTSPDFPFQSAGAGAYYLADDSRFHGVGAPTISPNLLRDLKTRTTDPPIVIADTAITTDTPYAPRARRETGPLDLGWAYDALDYLFGGCDADANLTFAPGTAVGWFRTSEGWCHAGHGIHITDGHTVSFNGTATDPCYWVRRSTVQEGIPGLWEGAYGPGGLTGWTPADQPFSLAPVVTMRFTKCSILAWDSTHMRDDWGYLVVHARDCEFWGGSLGGYCSQLNYTNCLFDSVSTWTAWNGVPSTNCTFILQNCLLHGGIFNLGRSAPDSYGNYPLWSVHDTAFDATSLLRSDAAPDNPTWTAFNYNAYLTGANTNIPPGDNDISVDTFNWQTNHFGNFYLPSDSPLKDSGSTTADTIGLFHFTTQTTQEKELSSQVDRSYHYVAVDSSGNPPDANANGIPDYLDPDSDSDGLPDWWEIKYFGDLTQVANSSQGPNYDYDGDSVDNATEYQNGTDPNKILFTVSYANDYVSGNTVAGTIQVSQGVPSQMAVLVDNANFDSAVWVPCNPSFTAPLPANDGRYAVWVGLRGRAADSHQTWSGTWISRDTTPPLIVITNPLATATTCPLLQLRGYATDPLASLLYDVSNADGVITSLAGSVSHQYYDTNLHAFTTNFFQCLDIDLSTGDNIITIRATDLAGNTTVTNFTHTLATDTDPPVITLGWPLDGTQISGDNFAVDGWLDDPAATVSASYTDGGGQAQTFPGIVERNGRFWIEDIPLPEGATDLALSAVDVWGNSASSTIHLHKSALGLALSLPDAGQLYKPALDLGGTIADQTYTVWVNGTRGVNNRDGTWSVTQAPVPVGGTATFQVTAYPSTENPEVDPAHPDRNPPSPTATEIKPEEDKPDRTYPESYTEALDGEVHGDRMVNGLLAYHCDDLGIESVDWHNNAESLYTWSGSSRTTFADGTVFDPDCEKIKITWPGAEWPDMLDGVYTYTSCDGVQAPPWNFGPYTLGPYEHCAVQEAIDLGRTFWLDGALVTDVGTQTYCRQAQTTVKLDTGGKKIPHRMNLFEITASADELLNPFATPPSVPTQPIDKSDITVGALGQPGNDGKLYVALADGETEDVTVSTSKRFYTFNVAQQKHELHIAAITNGVSVDLSTNVPEFCVGQLVQLEQTWDPPLPEATEIREWVAYPSTINKIIPAVGDASAQYHFDLSLEGSNPYSLWWYEGGPAKVWCTITDVFANGQKVSTFASHDASIYKPVVIAATDIPPAYATNYAGYLSLGDGNAHGDMVIEAFVFSTYPCRADITQRVLRDGANTYHDFTTHGVFYLDNNRFYTVRDNSPEVPHYHPANHAFEIELADNPAIGLQGYSARADDQFEDYIVFRPGIGNAAENIYVSLGVLTWKWSASMSWSLGGWSPPVGPPVTRPTFSPGTGAPPEWPHTYINQQ